MKKRSLLILIVVIAISFQTFANMQTTGWRWRNDDGNLESATWMAGDTVPVTIGADQVIRLRVRYDNPFDADDQNFTTTGLKYGVKAEVDQLTTDYTGTDEFDISGDNAVFTALGPDAYFDFVSSSYVDDGTETSNLGISFTSANTVDAQSDWTPGNFMSSSQSVVVNHITHTEIEYCIKPTANCVSGTYYFFGGGSDNIIYPTEPKLEVFPELTVDMSTGVFNSKVADFKVFSTIGNLKISALPRGIVNVTLYSLMGSVAKNLKVQTTNGAIDIPTSDLSQGIYILNVQSTNGKVQKKIFVN